MSDIDLTEAIDAAYDATVLERVPVAYSGNEHTEYFEGLYRNAITAALPHIERQVREQVAREIEAEADRRRRDADETASARGGTRDPHQDSIRAGFTFAARIARGDS